MSALREVIAAFGIEVDIEKLEHADNRIKEFIEKIGSAGKLVAEAFAVYEVVEFAHATAEAIHQVEAASRALGISAEATQEYGFAARAAGESAESLLNMMGRLQVTAANAAKGTGEGSKAFARLGVHVKDASGQLKPADELFDDVAEGISKIENPTERAALAVQLFGRQGRAMIPFLSRGKKGIEELREQFKKLGGGFDKEAIKKSEGFEEAWAKIGVVIDGVKGAIVKGLFPPLTWIIEKAAAIGGWFVRMTHNTHLFRNSLLVVGAALAPLAISMAAAFAPLLLAAAAVGAVVLVVDDLITLFEGGNSVIGDWLDKVFGKGESSRMVNEVKEAWEGVHITFTKMLPYVEKVVAAMKWVVDNAAKLGAFTGDAIGKEHVKAVEERAVASGDIKKGRAGLTYNEAAAAGEAQRYLDMQNRGEDVSKFSPSFKPADMNKDAFMASIMKATQMIQTDARFARFQPQTYGPSPDPAAPTVTNNITVNGANMTNDQVSDHIVKKIEASTNNRHRNAKQALTQAKPAT